MKNIKQKIVVILSLLITFCAVQAFSQPGESEDKTLSPYFFVNSKDPATDRLPIISTAASVNIYGVFADVLVTQIY